MKTRTFHKGSALVICVIFVAVFAALAVGLATISGANLQIADHQQEVNRAFANAESGLDVLKYWLNRVRIPSSTPTSQYLSATVSAIQNDLQDTGVSNLVVTNDGAIPPVTLSGAVGQTFSGQISADAGHPGLLQLRISGTSGNAARTIQVQFSIEPYRFPIFNYGIATKGALRFPQNPTLTGAASNWEADIYIESAGDITALQVGGNTNFDGDIDIANPLAAVDFQGDVQIAGDTGQAAIDNHVEVGADPVDFPLPETTRFASYATGGAIDPNSTSVSGVTLVNAVIGADMDPTFTGNVTIQGILYVEQPNVVTFTKNVQLQGLIVADGDAHNPGTNAINFQGNFSSGPYPPDSQFDPLRSEQGSSIVAPGFGVSFTGNFASVNGVMAASSMYFSANASALVKGTMISYSADPTWVQGNIALNFDRADAVEIPAGFDLLRVLTYDRTSYAMVF